MRLRQPRHMVASSPMNSTDRKAIAPNFSAWLLLTFVYLWPFFGVWAFNRPSWSGRDRNGFNRFNGILCLCLLDSIAIIAGLPLYVFHRLSKAEYVGICLLLIVVHTSWLNGHRGEELKRKFKEAPVKIRRSVGAVSTALFGGMLVWFVASTPQQPRPYGTLSCAKSAAEVSADVCSSQTPQVSSK